MDYNDRLRSVNYGLLWGMVAYNFGLLGFPGTHGTFSVTRSLLPLLQGVRSLNHDLLAEAGSAFDPATGTPIPEFLMPGSAAG